MRRIRPATPVGLVAALALGSAAAPAAAQDAPAVESGVMVVTGGSEMFGRDEVEAACADGGDEVLATLSATTKSPEPNGLATEFTAYAWFQGTDSGCTGSLPANLFAEATITLLAYTSNSTITLPGTFRDQLFDEKVILEELDRTVCDEGAIVSSVEKRFCMAVDFNGNKNIEEATTVDTLRSGDLYASAIFKIDTEAPPVSDPPELLPLDGALQVIPCFSAVGETDDVTHWEVRFREDDAGASNPCDEWATTEFSTVEASTDTLCDGGFRLDDLDNGVTYAVCVAAVDDAGNQGPFSPVSTGAPREECDFIECFPGGAPVGHCSAIGSPLGALLIGALCAARRRRRARSEQR